MFISSSFNQLIKYKYGNHMLPDKIDKITATCVINESLCDIN